MNLYKKMLLLGLALLLSCNSPQKELAEADNEGAEAIAVKELQQNIIEAFNNQDLDRLFSYFHPDVAYLVPSVPALQGWEAVRARYDKSFTRFRKENACLYLQVITHEVVVLGDWAWARGDAKLVWSECGSAPVFASDLLPGSKHLTIYKKENGKWLRYRQMRNGNTPETNF